MVFQGKKDHIQTRRQNLDDHYEDVDLSGQNLGVITTFGARDNHDFSVGQDVFNELVEEKVS